MIPGTLKRGLRNVYRNKVRSLLVILILAVSVGIFVTMTQASAASQAQGQTIRQQVATLIQVNPLGAPAAGGGRRTLPEDLAIQISAVPDVVRVEKYLRRQIADNSKPFAMGVAIGAEPGATLRLSSMGGFIDNPRIIAGRGLEPASAGQPVAVVGQVFAQQYGGLQVGDTFELDPRILRRAAGEAPPDIPSLTLRVVGIHAVDVVWGDNQIFIPLDVAQRWLGQEGQVTQFWVAVDAADNVGQVEADLRALLGDQADILTEQASANFTAETLRGISANSLLAAAVAAVIGALVTLFIMMLVTRERTREIGVLKAIGASDWDVALQFAAESLALALVGGLAGLVVAAGAGSVLLSTILGSAGASLAPTINPGLSPVVVGAALGLAVLFGLVGSLYPVRRAVQMRPAEALRYE
jgi:ABC-type antimicrobial peptide transport system permease subunit